MRKLFTRRTKGLLFGALLPIFALLCTALPALAANSVYIAETSLGTGTGTSCANAEPYTYFNTAGNWSATPTGIQIGPGTTVTLCGTISNVLIFNGSGASGNPIIIQFDPTTAGTLSVPTTTGEMIWLGGSNYITFIGKSAGGTAADCEATDNGSTPANGGTFGNNNTFSCINGNNSHDITIENFGCYNLYQHTSVTDSAALGDTSGCYYANPVGVNVSIHDSTFHDEETGILAIAGTVAVNLQVYNDNLYNINHFVEFVCSTTASDIYVHDNRIHDAANWDTGVTDTYHHDGHFMNGSSNGNCSNIYDYNNWYYGDWGQDNTSPIFEDPNGSPLTIYSSVYIFNDVFQNSNPTYIWNNGIAAGAAGFWNNTVLCPSSGGLSYELPGTMPIDYRNDVEQGCQQFLTTGIDASATLSHMDYNVYANLISSGNSAFTYLTQNSGSGTLAAQFAAWQTVVQGITSGSEAHSAEAATANLNSNGFPLSGSPVIGAATNLTSLCSGTLVALCSDTSLGKTRTPTARPASGNWDVGAYNYSHATVPIAPCPACFVMLEKNTLDSRTGLIR